MKSVHPNSRVNLVLQHGSAGELGLAGPVQSQGGGLMNNQCCLVKVFCPCPGTGCVTTRMSCKARFFFMLLLFCMCQFTFLLRSMNPNHTGPHQSPRPNITTKKATEYAGRATEGFSFYP